MRPLAAGSRAALAAVRFYQRYLSGLKPPTCRFWPTCSNYAVEAIGRHGLRRGGWLTLRRLLRCHPFNPGGVDPVPPASGEEKNLSMRIRCGNE